MKNIIIIDYGCGNLLNLSRAIEFIGQRAEVTRDKDKIINATHLILPGVGAFKKAMEKLEQLGLKTSIKEYTKQKKPLLGICLGMQLLFSKSFEFGSHAGLDLIEGEVIKLKSEDKNVKIPHIGWNEIYPKFTNDNSKKIFTEDLYGKNFYFIHSFIGISKKKEKTNGFAEYMNISIPAFVSSENTFGCQFHPEKSGRNGIKLLKNFCNL